MGYKLLTVVDPNVAVSAVGCGLDRLVHVVAKVANDAYLKAVQAENAAAHRLARHEVISRLAEYRNTLGSDAINDAAKALGYTAEVDDVEDAVIEE